MFKTASEFKPIVKFPQVLSQAACKCLFRLIQRLGLVHVELAPSHCNAVHSGHGGHGLADAACHGPRRCQGFGYFTCLARTTPPDQMALVFSIKQTGVPVGAMMAGALVPTMMLNIDWQMSLLVVALACLISAALAQLMRQSTDDQRQPGLPFEMGTLTRPIRMVLGHRNLATMATCSFMFSIVQLSLTTYLVTYLHNDLSYGMVSAGLLLSVTQFGGIGGRIAWGVVSDRWLGAPKTLALLACIMALSALVTALLLPTLPLWGIWITLIAFGASAIGWNGVYLAEVARQAPAGKASMATGGTLTFTFLGAVVGSPIFGMLSSLFGTYQAGFLALALPSCVCAWMLMSLKNKPTLSHE